ncbi:MAG: SprT-like domain-containing protein [Bacteroidota bacterium]
MSSGKTLKDVLAGYLPAGCSEPVAEWFGNHRIVLRVTRNRRSKLGDFRGGRPLAYPCISINHSLNPYSFIITLIHEMAHAEIFLSGSRGQKPHGEHWKEAYRRLAVPFLKPGMLPEDVRIAFAAYLENPFASSTACVPLVTALRKFDISSGNPVISELAEEALFALPDGRVFKRGAKLRKRYKCICLNNKRVYLFSPLAEIIPVDNK